MNGGFRLRPDDQFVANSLNARTTQKGIQESGKINETPSTVAQTNQSVGASPLPSISLPKGGGAIRGIGEKLSANPVTGTGSLNVPIFTSPGRSGFGPQLSLSYDSGSGNGPFGFGWSLSLPSITRKTDKGLPRYQDAIESDVFILSGAEDLVPVFKKDENENWVYDRGNLVFDEELRDGYMVRRYRPRIEGLFARIERWTHEIDGDVHWRSISKDNILTVYGRDKQSRIYDSADKSRIFSWLICESYDDKGNAILYEYMAENKDGVDTAQANERNRSYMANLYLKRIKYGNRKPLLLDKNVLSFRGLHIPQPDLKSAEWMFEVVFDYGEGHYKELDYDKDPAKHQFIHASSSASGTWECRPDPFSTYRAGFEVRTYRRCFRVLMFHYFEELFKDFPKLKNEPYLVRSTEFDYSDLNHKVPFTVEDELKHKGSTRFVSFIQKITQSGYVYYKSEDLPESEDVKYLTYLKKSLPPLEFDYSKAIIQEEIKEIDAESLENLPYGLDGAGYQWVDLDGEGLSGILTEQAGAWFYKPNLGEGKFGPMVRVAVKPSLAVLNSGRTQLLDLAGDGQLDVVELDGPVPGFYERTYDQSWENFIPFTSLPNVTWKDPNLKFVDLTGDGHADVMITEDEVIAWYPSLAEEGFGEGEKVHQSFDEEKGPRLVFADGTQSIYLSDMSGDGLSDLVRIRNGEVCYWPNMGYGRFGAKVTMDNAPWFDSPDQFDQKRIRLADVDGSGTTDIIYLGRNGVQIYFNQSGNNWSGERMLSNFPNIDNLESIQAADLRGNGTACLVWSSPLPGNFGRQMRYIDLMGGQKPHLLIGSKNNLGAETKVTYVASTKFYLQDKAAGKPWVTRIPFPVHVVEQVETFDLISKNRFVTRYAYHHGYFDGIEREFRGFGMVEQWDTEEFAVLSASDSLTETTNIDKASNVPPAHTKTWYHTGAFLQGQEISRQLAYEYFGAPKPDDPVFETFLQSLLEDTVMPSVSMTPDETNEACRALKGSILRQEIYADDASIKAGIPYSVSERNYTIEFLQPRESNQHGIFFTHANETIDYHYDRNIQDPRIQHELVLEVDDFGNVLKSAAVGYGRLQSDLPDSDDQKKQTTTLITYTQNDMTNSVNDEDAYRTSVIWQTRTYELTGYNPTAGTIRFAPDDFGKWQNNKFILKLDKEINYEEMPTNSRQRRLIEHVRTLYRSNKLDSLLSPGTIESLALPGETYKLAFTPGLLTKVFGTRTNDNMFTEGGYVHSKGDINWWISSGLVFYDINADDKKPGATSDAELAEACQHFFLPRKFTDPFGHSITVNYDQPDDLLIVETEDPVKNVVHAENDYRVLQPKLVTDPNENRSQVVFDALGMVAGTALMGKQIEPDGKPKGDSLDEFEPNLTQAQLEAFIAKPRELGANPSESAAAQIVHDLLGKATSRIIYDLDRFKRLGEPPFAATIAREIHNSDLTLGQKSKLQISFSYSDGFGREIQKKIQAEPLAEGGTIINPRWVGSGWTIFNNKGKPVKKYEPFFSPTHEFEFEKIEGFSSTLFYDPVERVVATLHPNHTYEKVVFDPWQQETWDVNDTINPMQVFDPRSPNILPDHTFSPADDLDVGEYFRRLPKGEYLPTWYDVRMDSSKAILKWPDMDPISGSPIPENKIIRAAEKSAATKAAKHAATPIRAYLDTLGRTFLTIADNGLGLDGKRQEYKTHIELDIENNQREIIDAKDRIVMRYDYDMLSNRIHQESMEAGERWMLNDVTGKPIRAWDSRGHNFWTEYDELRRPMRQFVKGMDANHSDPRTLNADVLFAKTEYGENQANDIDLNLRTRVYKQYDSAGVLANKASNPVTGKEEAYDFKGNLLRSSRELRHDYYKNVINWSASIVTDETFTGSTTYDALNRPIQIVTPHRTGTKLNVIQPVYNEANLLEREDIWLEQENEPEELLDPDTATYHTIKNIDYNAKGQRELIVYGNDVSTTYKYDPFTFRLEHLKTLRSKELLQDISYTYDPAGNITAICDDAQQTIYFNGQVVRPDAEYTYDAIYRLIEADGREHIGQVSQPQTTWNDGSRINLAHPNDGQKMRNYFESYTYDEVGNILLFDHKAQNGNWNRSFNYNEDGLIETGKKSNRLSSTVVHPDGQNPITEPHTYDPHGNMTSMPHLQQMNWNFEDGLQMVDKGGGSKAYYVYDATGQRVRKVMEENGTLMEERIYIGGYEVYRKYNGSNTGPILERESLHIMDDKQGIALIDIKTIDSKNTKIKLPETLIRYQLGNHLGSVALELDENADVISYEEYYPYGSTSYQAGRSQAEVRTKRYRYTGKERDEESGLYYSGARYYAPWLGRWTASDPAALLGSQRNILSLTNHSEAINLYEYALNKPITHLDNSGLSAQLGYQLDEEYDIEKEINKEQTLKSNKETASYQLHAIKNYLTYVGAAQAGALGLKGPERERFVIAESKAVSMLEVNGQFLLYVDLNTAMEGRGNRRVSWVLERLYHLTQFSKPVRVVTGKGVSPEGTAGQTPEVDVYNKDLDPEQRVPNTVCVRKDPPNPDYWKARSDISVGRTLVHELISHAWRDILFLEKFRRWGLGNPSSFEYSGHRAETHAQSDTTKHSWPDREADVLDWYLEKNPTYTKQVEALKKKHYEPDEVDKRHMKLWPKMVGEAGGLMGQWLYLDYWQKLWANPRAR